MEAGTATSRSDPMEWTPVQGEHTPSRFLVLSSRMNYSQANKQLVLQLCIRDCKKGAQAWPGIISIPIRRGTLTFFAISKPVKSGAPSLPTSVGDMIKHIDVVKNIVVAAGIVDPLVEYDGDSGWTDRNAAITLARSSGSSIFGERAHSLRVTYNYSETITKLNNAPNGQNQSTARIVNRMRGHLANMHSPDTVVGAPVLDAPPSAFNWRFVNKTNNFSCPISLLDLENYHLHRCPAINAPMFIETTSDELADLEFETIYDACTWINEHMCFRDSPDEWLHEVTKAIRVVSLDVGTACLSSHSECTAAATGFVVAPSVIHQKHGDGGYAIGTTSEAPWNLCNDTPCDVVSIVGPCDSYRELLIMEWKKSINLLFDLHANGQKPLSSGVNKTIPNVPIIVFDYAQMRELFLNDTWYWATHNVPVPHLTHGFLEERKLVRLALEIAIDIKADLQQVLSSSRLGLAKNIADYILSDAEILPSHVALDFNYQCLALGRTHSVNTNASGKRSFDVALSAKPQVPMSESVANTETVPDGESANAKVTELEAGAREAGYRGGLVLQAKPGIYSETTEFDFDSHYASIMVEYAQFYTAANRDDNERLSARFKQQIHGWVLKKRQYKSQPDKADLSFALKLKNNILYGCMGRQGNNVLSNTALASSITAHGRKLLERVISSAPSLNSILMGHTDALLVSGLNAKGEWDVQCELLCNKVNEGLNCVRLRVARRYQWSWILNKTRHISVIQSVGTFENVMTALISAASAMVEAGKPTGSLGLDIETNDLQNMEWHQHDRFESVAALLSRSFVFPGLIVRSMPSAAQAITLFSSLIALSMWIYESPSSDGSFSPLDFKSTLALLDSNKPAKEIMQAPDEATSKRHSMLDRTLYALDILFERHLNRLEEWIHWIETPSESINITVVTRNDNNYRHYIKTRLRQAEDAIINATAPHNARRAIASQRYLPVMRSCDTRNYEPVSYGTTKLADVDCAWWRRRIFETLERHMINTPSMSADFRTRALPILARLILGKVEFAHYQKKKGSAVLSGRAQSDDAMDIDGEAHSADSTTVTDGQYLSPTARPTKSAIEAHKAAIHKAESLWAELLTTVPGANEQWSALPDAKRIAERLLPQQPYVMGVNVRSTPPINTTGTSEAAWLERFFLPFAVKHPNAIGNQDALRDYVCARVLERYDFQGAITQLTSTTELFEVVWRRSDVRQHAEAFKRATASVHEVLTRIFFVS